MWSPEWVVYNIGTAIFDCEGRGYVAVEQCLGRFLEKVVIIVHHDGWSWAME